MNIKLEIPDSFYQGEEKCKDCVEWGGYYVSPEMKKVWAVELDLIAEFDRVCKKHDLKWWADGGTLLGAARHKGFIPWDDDVDVTMMRKDYERLREIAPNEFSYPYVLKTPENEPNMGALLWSKLFNESTALFEDRAMRLLKNKFKVPHYSQGIFIDVFVLDDVPDDLASFRKLMKKALKSFRLARRLINVTEAYAPAPKLWKRYVKAILHYMLTKMNVSGYKYLVETMNAIKSYTNPNSKYVASLCSLLFHPNMLTRDMNDIHELFDRSYYEDTLYLPFEMLTIPVPSGYENVLNNWYGNWKEYVVRPPHGLFYDTEHSYTYYTEEGHPV